MAYSEEAKSAKWQPVSADVGVQQVTVRARDSWGAYSQQRFDLHTVSDFCEIYPIALPQSLLATARTGELFTNVSRGTGAGNFGWLTWTGVVAAPTLAESLLSPGDSYDYVNPDNASDRLLEIADWARGATGSMNSSSVRERMDALKSRDIVLPTWDAIRGAGDGLGYKVAKFATVRLKSYDLTGQGTLSFEFRGYKNCYNDAPVAPQQAVATNEDQSVSFALAATDPEHDLLTYQILQAPAHGQLIGTGAQLTYVPAADYFGTDTFTYVASDGEFNSGVATVSIAVAPVDDPPTASSAHLQTLEDVPLTLNLDAQDVDTAALSYRIVSGPGHGSLSGTGSALTYTPDANFHGEDSLQWSASDGIYTAVATISITVVESNDPPVARNIQLQVQAGTRVDILLAATDPDGDALNYRLTSQPDHGALSGTAPNLGFVPDAAFSGAISFTYLANDGRLDSAPATVTLQVYGQNHPPSIVSSSSSFIDEGAGWQYDLDAVDPDTGDTFKYRLDNSIFGASIDRDSGWMQWPADSSLVGSVRELNKACRKPVAGGTVDPVLQWEWTGSPNFPDYDQVMTTPLVGQMSDDNGDGRIDANDDTDIVVITWPNTSRGAYDTKLNNAAIRIFDGKTGREIRTIKTTPGVDGYSFLALADIDGDGQTDIVVPDQNSGIQVLRADGTQIWRRGSLDGKSPYGRMPSVADLDGDGHPEIVVGTYVLSYTGQVLWRLSGWSGRPATIGTLSGVVSISDLDDDGKQEIVAGGMAYRADGTVLWKNTAVGDGYTAIGNLVGDARPEIVVVHGGSVFLLSATGQKLWGAAIPKNPFTSISGGPPTLADMDGDGQLEIGVAGNQTYTVFNADGSVLWKAATDDRSEVTGSTVFDFDGDGEAEIVYNDEHYLRILRGRDGAVLFQALSTSGTTMEYPVVANVDDDPEAEIIAGSSSYFAFFDGQTTDGTTHGLRVFQSATHSWQPTRSIWNQHAYHIDNINDDGTVPAGSTPSWKTHNTWRLNTFLDRDPGGLPDLALFDLRLDPASPHSLHVTARNRGLGPTSAQTVVHVYNGANASAPLLTTLKVPVLASGEDRDLRLDNVDTQALGDMLYAVVDDIDSVAECAENNNAMRVRIFHARATDQGGLYDSQVFTVGVLDIDSTPVLLPVTAPAPRIGQKYRLTVKATDADVGDGLLYRLDSAPIGMSIDAISGEVRWTPYAEQAGTVSFQVRVTDLRGASATRTISVELPPNHPPTIDSTAPTAATSGQPYLYNLKASDPDGDTLSYRFDDSPFGMTIAPTNGAIRWTPPREMLSGPVHVRVRVTDANHGEVFQDFTIDLTAPVNHAPVFDSTPQPVVALGQRYDYDADARDEDGDAVQYTLLEAPAGMLVDTVTGLVVWQPQAEEVGLAHVRLQAIDQYGAATMQEFDVVVSGGLDGGNHPPSIDSMPETSVLIGSAYAYNVVASDMDGDALSYALTQAPAGMSIDPATGALHWTPTSDQAGLNAVEIVVSDGHGGSGVQSFGVLVYSAPTGGGGGGGSSGGGNHPPTITSNPLTQVTLGTTYRYYPTGTDPDGDALTYSLANGPSGMSVDPVTGLIAWTPQALGSVGLSLRVSDGRGGSAKQSFTITVVSSSDEIDHLPVMTAAPATAAKVGVKYQLQLQVVDSDGDALHFQLLEGPTGASVDASTGLIDWTPAAEGNVSFKVRITSGDGYSDVTWTVTVVSAETPLTVHVVANPERVAPGGAYVAGMQFHGAGGPVQVTATLGGQPITLDADGETALVAPATPGHYTLDVAISDGSQTASDSADLFVSDPADTTPPTVSISSPAIDARVTAPTPVFGEVAGNDVARWTLSLQDKATGALTPIANGTSASGPGVLGTLDPTLSTNGFYTLILQAWDQGGNEASASRTVLIDGEMKLGHFSLSFEDVSIPMAGLPIRVTRTYDTRRRNERLAFGWGWSVDYQNVRLTESRAPGYSWTLVSERNGFFGNWCVRPNGDPIVAVTGPDGKLMKFRAKASPECQFAAPQPDVNIVFEALPGTNAQLEQTDYDIVRLTQVAGSGVYNLLDMGDTEQAPANPSHYRLKLPDGTVYSITQGVGLTQVSEPDGNTLTYNAGGIHHSRGQDLTFLRDGQGRIEQIVLPDGRRRRYTYTAAGDLEIAVDTGLDLTSFTYLPQAPRYLRDIIDPRGVRVSRNEYDDNGRLVATIDAEGHRIEYTHNLDGRLETIKDRRGYASTYAYDSEGRVTAESNARGETTLHKYDANGNELETTDPLLHVTKRTFDAHGNLLTETNPLGQKVTRTYDDKNNVLTQVDALGRTVASNAYHAYNGKLVMTQDALGGVTTFGYDSGLGSGGTGELTGIVGADNAATRYEVNFFGHRFRETNAAGGRTDYELDTAGRVHGEYKYVRQADGSTEALWTHYTLDDKDRIVATRHPDGSTSTVEYDGNGKPLKSCDGLNRCTLQSYNDRGELERATYPDGTYEESQYDENGNLSSRRDRAGRVTKMEYDEANRLVETILPDATPGDDADNPRTKSEYDAAGRMTASIDELGHRTTYGYDDAGRRVWVKDALGHVTTTDYDAAGQRVAVTDALGHTTRFVYDLAGRLVQTVHPDTTLANPDDNPRTSIEYDAAGRKFAEIDELGRRKQYAYDALGRLVAVTLPNPATGLIDGGELVTRYAYDDAGNKLRQIDALGRITAWEYDAMGRQIRRILPGGQSESMQYDAAGQLVAKTDFNGVATRYSYDAAGRLAGTDYAHDADVITTYTDSGQRESVTDGQGTTLYQYDARDRLVRVQYPDGNAIAYGYDAAGNRTALHSPAQDQAFVFDELNRLSEVHTRVLGGAERVARYGYDAVGNRTALTQADGTMTTTVFDERSRLRQLFTRTAASVLLFGATYEVDAAGARTGIAESDASGPTRTVAYAYDGVKRLTAEVIARAGQPARATEYTYDAVGNRLTKTEAGTLTTYVVDDNDRLLSEITAGTTTIYTYDSNGNTTGQAKPSSWTHYTFDEANRLVRTQTSAGADVATGYGAEGVRNRETVAGGATTTWLIDGNREYAQTLEAYAGSQLTTTWTYGNELLSQVGVNGGGLHERNLSTDGMGSVRHATDGNGQLTDTFVYDAFGNDLGRTGTSDIDHRYRGEQVDPNTGFYNLRARWYDIRIGRFVSADSWVGRGLDPGSFHKYLFTAGDPVNHWDPTGHYTQRFGYSVEKEVEDQYRAMHPYCGFRGAPGMFGICYFGSSQYYEYDEYLKPDIMDWATRQFAEIKPFTPSGIAKGSLQLAAYTAVYGAFAGFSPNTTWTPFPTTVEGVPTYFVNAGGIIFYNDDASYLREFYAVTLATAAATFRKYAANVATELGAEVAARALANNAARTIGMSRASQLVGQTELAVTIEL
jgi:RHS repeat-associated protein